MGFFFVVVVVCFKYHFYCLVVVFLSIIRYIFFCDKFNFFLFTSFPSLEMLNFQSNFCHKKIKNDNHFIKFI